MLVGVATSKHTELNLPGGYAYVEAGAERHEKKISGIFHDDEGISISQKNNTYCELTVLYWLWKNRSDDIKGLCHYRRFFSRNSDVKIFTLEMKNKQEVSETILTENLARQYLNTYDMILLMPYNPGNHNAREDLRRYLYEKDIDSLDQLMADEFHEYLDSYLEVMHSCNLSYCNMLIAGKEVFDAYCTWLFKVLSEYEKRIDLNGYDSQHQRIYGYVAEVLLNVWVRKNGIRPMYLNLLGVEEYWSSFTGKIKCRGFRLIESTMRNPAGRKMYELLLKTVRNQRYNNYLMLKQKYEKNELDGEIV